jgi:hypothetical protein
MLSKQFLRPVNGLREREKCRMAAQYNGAMRQIVVRIAAANEHGAAPT